MDQPTLEDIWARGVGFGFAMATGGALLSARQMAQANLAFKVMMELGEETMEHLKHRAGVIKDA